MVFSKRKTDDMRHKVFFINADKEYREGKKQNMLRPEDIEKISYVYLNKIEVPAYSRLVDLSEIEANDYTLNIRKYVDNTPPPEPQDVHAHLVGGVPDAEIKAVNTRFADKLHYNSFSLYTDNGQRGYKHFSIKSKDAIKELVENNAEVMGVVNELHTRLAAWWKDASDEFSAIAGNRGTALPKVRASLMHSMKECLQPVGMLDQYQVAGIFVNWWDGVKYDLKTIMQSGWDIDLVYPDYQQIVIDAFFQREQSAIETAALRVAAAATELEVKIEEALELAEYDADDSSEGEEAKHTSKFAYEALASTRLECGSDEERKPYIEMEENLRAAEASLKETKAELARLEDDLRLRIELKCHGVDDKRAEAEALREQTKQEIALTLGKAVDALDMAGCLMADAIDTSSMAGINDSLAAAKKAVPAQKSKRTADDERTLQRIDKAKKALKPLQKQHDKLQKEFEKIEKKIADYDLLMQDIGGKVTVEEAKMLILRKHYDIIASHLDRYADSERRAVIAACEHLWDKYSVSANDIAEEHKRQMEALTATLRQLKYLD